MTLRNMTLHDRMSYHVALVEELSREIEEWETKARRFVKRRYASNIEKLTDPYDQEHLILFHVQRLLGKKLIYQNRVRGRDYNIAMAQMNGLAAIADGSDRGN